MTQTAERKDARRREGKRSAAGNGAAAEAAVVESRRPGRRTRQDAGPSANTAPLPAPAASRRNDITVGAEPRVHLLPPEVMADRRAAVIRSRLALGVVGVIAVVVVGILGASALAASSQGSLAADQAQTQLVLKQQLSYVKVRAVQDQLSLIRTAQEVGASTEIAWTPYLQKVQQTLPAGVAIIGVAIDSSTPLAFYTQPTASLQGPRVATIVFTALSPSLPQVPSWLLALRTLPGYADALPGSVTLQQGGAYSVTITMHVNEKAFSGRFSPASASKTGK